MQKLEKAGWLTHRAAGRSYITCPLRSRDAAGTTTLRTFIDRVFRGDPLLLFQHLLEDEALDDQDLSTLKENARPEAAEGRPPRASRAHD